MCFSFFLHLTWIRTLQPSSCILGAGRYTGTWESSGTKNKLSKPGKSWETALKLNVFQRLPECLQAWGIKLDYWTVSSLLLRLHSWQDESKMDTLWFGQSEGKRNREQAERQETMDCYRKERDKKHSDVAAVFVTSAGWATKRGVWGDHRRGRTAVLCQAMFWGARPRAVEDDVARRLATERDVTSSQ